MAEARIFGHNGMVLDEIAEDKLESLLKLRRFHVWYPALLVVSIGTLYLCNYWLSFVRLDGAMQAMLVCATAGCFVASAFVAQAQTAIEDFKLPYSFGLEPHYRHVSGGMVLVISFAITVIMALLRLVDANHDHLVMDGRVGLIVVGLIAAAFGVYILSPRVISSKTVVSFGRGVARVRSRSSSWAKPFNLIGRGVSVIDSWLVHIVAPAVGVSQRKGTDRYGVLLAYLATSGALAWYFPAPWGLIPAGFWFVVAISVARRWAWIEDDREVTLRKPHFDETELKVGVSEDLRDEALMALVSLIMLLPLAMRQIHTGFGEPVFSTPEDYPDTLWTWLAFFGLELAKAVPFVDWADIYDVRTDYFVQAESALAHHVVFVSRAIVDLVFLSALLQAVSISMKLSRHKKMFFDREINLLDPMVEKVEFEQLAYRSDGDWKVRPEAERFAHYDPVRLSSLRARNSPDTAMYCVATAIKNLQHEYGSTPAERFLEAVCMKEPVDDEVASAWKRALQHDEVPLEFMVAAREQLNNRPRFNAVRLEIAQKIAEHSMSVERNTALRNMLVGTRRDAILDIRRLAIEPLLSMARWDHRIIKALKAAMKTDRSKVVRKLAQDALHRLGFAVDSARKSNRRRDAETSKPKSKVPSNLERENEPVD